MALDDLRRRIDELDDRLLALLAERADLAAAVAQEKRAAGLPPHDPEREQHVIDRVTAAGAGGFPRASLAPVFREIVSACLSLQEPQRVAYLGPEGTFTHVAARALFGLAARYREATTIEGVFDAVRRGDAAFGVVPIENSTEGAVTAAADALLDGDLRIRRERVVEIAHCLLSQAPSLAAIERVCSHPQALAQCRAWLARHLAHAQIVQTPSTAAAAREAHADARAAALGSRLAGELYGVPVVAERVQDRAENATRFVVIAARDAPPTGDDKTSLAFSAPDERGALRRVLEVFDRHGLNLTRLESRPSRRKAWDYVFFCDLEGHREDAPVAAALADLAARCAMVKVLGSYPRHRLAVTPPSPDAP